MNEGTLDPLSGESLAPPYIKLEKDIGELNHRLNLLGETLNDYAVDHPEEDDAAMGAIGTYAQECALARAHDQPEPEIPHIIDSYGVPEAIIPTVTETMQGLALVQEKEAQLETFVPEKRAEVLGHVTDMVATLDYEKAAAAMGERRIDHRHVSYPLMALAILQDNSPLNFGQLNAIESNLGAYQESWERWEIVGQGPNEQKQQTDPTENEITIKTIRTYELISERETALLDAQLLAARFNSHNAAFSEASSNSKQATTGAFQALTEIRQMKTQDFTYDDLDDYGLIAGNDRFVAAVVEHQLQIVESLDPESLSLSPDTEAYQREAAEARAIDATQALDSIRVAGEFEGLPISLDDESIRKFLAESIPALALQITGSLEIRPLTPEEKTHDRLFGFHKYDTELGESKIVISTQAIEKSYKSSLELFGKSDDPESDALFATREELFHYLAHEFAHALHTILPPAALKRWEGSIADDPTFITSYVKDSFDDKHADRYKEDFAESLGMFVTNPSFLRAFSPARYEAMQQIYQDFMPGYDEKLRREHVIKFAAAEIVWTGRGWSHQDIRDRFLPKQ